MYILCTEVLEYSFLQLKLYNSQIYQICDVVIHLDRLLCDFRYDNLTSFLFYELRITYLYKV